MGTLIPRFIGIRFLSALLPLLCAASMVRGQTAVPAADNQLAMRLTSLDTTSFPDITIRLKLFRGMRVVRDTSFTSVIVTENGVVQNATLTCPFVPFSVALVLDRSYSMAFYPNTQIRDPDSARWRSAKAALHTFISQLSPLDQGALISFARDPTIDQGMTSDKQRLDNAIEGIRLGSGTGIWKASQTAITLLSKLTGERAIVLLTDGEDNSSGLVTPDDIVTLAKNAGIRIYTVGLGEDVGRAVLSDVATRTGGEFFFSANGSDLTDIYYDISSRLVEDCTLRYRTTNRCTDGTVRDIVINGIYESDPVTADTSYTAPLNVPTVHITLPGGVMASSSDFLRLPVILADSLEPDQRLSFSGTLAYPADALDFVEVNTTGYPLEGFPVQSGAANGAVTVRFDTANLAAGLRGPLCELVFRVRVTQQSREVDFTWSDVTMQRTCALNVQAYGERAVIDGVCEHVVRRVEQGTLPPNFPNPVSGRTTVPYIVPAAAGSGLAHARVRILDAIGNTVSELVSGDLQPGAYSVEWDARRLSSGMYTIEYILGATRTTRRVLVLR